MLRFVTLCHDGVTTPSDLGSALCASAATLVDVCPIIFLNLVFSGEQALRYVLMWLI